MSKKTNYNPSEYFDYSTISAVKLISAQDYQRDVSKARVNKIVKNFDPYKINPIKVAFRDGKYYVFDGQHTLSAIIQLYGINTIVPVMIFKEITHEIEALLFATQDENKKKLGIQERLMALYISGDEDVTYFKRACELYGFNCDFRSGTKDRSITSYGYLYDSVYKKHGAERLNKILRIVSRIWGRKAECTYSQVLKGLNCFIDNYDGVYNEDILVGALNDTSALEIKRDGNADTTRKGDERYAAQILTDYNNRCKNKKTPKLKIKF